MKNRTKHKQRNCVSSCVSEGTQRGRTTCPQSHSPSGAETRFKSHLSVTKADLFPSRWCSFPQWLKNLRVILPYNSQELGGTGTSSWCFWLTFFQARKHYSLTPFPWIPEAHITKAIRNKMSQSQQSTKYRLRPVLCGQKGVEWKRLSKNFLNLIIKPHTTRFTPPQKKHRKGAKKRKEKKKTTKNKKLDSFILLSSGNVGWAPTMHRTFLNWIRKERAPFPNFYLPLDPLVLGTVMVIHQSFSFINPFYPSADALCKHKRICRSLGYFCSCYYTAIFCHS